MSLFAYVPKTEYLSWAAAEAFNNRQPTEDRFLKEVGTRQLLGAQQLEARRSHRFFFNPSGWLDSKAHYQIEIQPGWSVKMILQ
jgi:hypothetical protein